ncbi:MAG: hypothetical protein IJX91_02515 [Clostridia bacterium]|nr:hypothetical protein [Clostridia bacterium]
MKLWKKTLMLLAGFGLAFGLTACGDDKGSSSGGSKKSSNELIEGEKITVSFEENDTAIYTFTPKREDNYVFMAYAGSVEDMLLGDAGELYMYLYDEDDEEVGQYAFGSDCGNPIAIAGDLEEGEKYTLELISEDVSECSLFVLGEENEDMAEDILGEEFADIMGGNPQSPSDSEDDSDSDGSDTGSDTDGSDSDSDTNGSDSDGSDTDSDSGDTDMDDPFDDVIVASVGEYNTNTVEIEESGQKKIYRFETNGVNGATWTFVNNASRTVVVTIYDCDGHIWMSNVGVEINAQQISANSTLNIEGLSTNAIYYIEVGYQSASRTGEFTFNLYPDTVAGETFETAIEAVIGENSAYINQSGQLVYYVFTPSVSGTYNIYGTMPSTDYDTKGYLYNAEYTQLVYDDDGANNWQFSIFYELTAGETYYIATCMSNNYGSFTFTIEREYAEGETFETAIEAELGTYTVEIENYGYKYYAFTPEVTATYNIYSSAYSDTDAYLYDYNQYELDYDDQGGGNGDFRISYELSAGNTYYIKVGYCSGGYSGSFDFTIDRESVAGETFETAIEAVMGTNNVTVSNADGTYYVFRPTASGAYTFTSQANNNDPRIVLYDSEYNQIDSDDDSAEYPNFLLTRDLEAGQTYYIRVHLGGNTGTFSFEMSAVILNGNSFGTAIEATAGQYETNIATAGQIVYYKITNDSSYDRQYTFYSSIYSTQYDTYGILYNALNEQVASDDDSGSEYRQYEITYTIRAGETYYLVSKMWSDDHTGTFYTNIEVEKVGASRTSAIEIYSTGTYTAPSDNYSIDVWFKFVPTDSNYYVFTVNNTTFNSGIALYDTYDYCCASDSDSNAGSFIQSYCNSGETYYVVVNATTSYEYSLNVSYASDLTSLGMSSSNSSSSVTANYLYLSEGEAIYCKFTTQTYYYVYFYNGNSSYPSGGSITITIYDEYGNVKVDELDLSRNGSASPYLSRYSTYYIEVKYTSTTNSGGTYLNMRTYS